jgi:hypothetical protein|tara:strand:+ start:714 stop:1097 length:384 start_codon:yes stop_codon:yes gene_type:complete
MNKRSFIKIYRKKFLGWFLALITISFALYYGVDRKVIVFTAFVVSIFTEIFVGLGVLIAAIPIIGPLIIKVISIPIFLILNAMGAVVSGIAIKKGYATEMARGKIITLALLIGIIIGYILGNLIPIQ